MMSGTSRGVMLVMQNPHPWGSASLHDPKIAAVPKSNSGTSPSRKAGTGSKSAICRAQGATTEPTRADSEPIPMPECRTEVWDGQ